MNTEISVLVVDDDPQVRDFLSDYLGEQRYRVRVAVDSSGLRQALATEVPDVVLLDVNLPGEDGLSLARFLREHHNLPVLMISAAGTALDRIVGLEVGADDYLVKPFDPRELVARLKSVLRRYQPLPTDTDKTASKNRGLRLGDCLLDMERRTLHNRDNQEIPLTAMEFDLLAAFASRPNRPLSRDQLLNLTQNRDWNPYDRSIDIRIARLRTKLEPDPAKPQIIRTLRGVGYMLVSSAD
jgi:DNA-binding response OmpR family regulator